MAFVAIVPRLASPRRLCQPPWTHTISKEPHPPRMGTQVRRKRQAYSQLLFGRGPGGGASLREAASPGVHPSHSRFGREREGGASRREAASLAVTSRSPPRMGAQLRKSNQAYSQLLFGRGSGGGASLREAASPGVHPPHSLFGREREGGGFSQRSPLPRKTLVLPLTPAQGRLLR